MDRRQRLAAIALCLWAACGGASSYGTGAPIGPGAKPSSSISGLRPHAALSKGKLTYAVALSSADRVAFSVELGVEFSLAVHDLGDGKLKPRLRFRKRLGVATYDVHDLAIDHRRNEAWVASADGRVRGFNGRTGKQLADIHVGAPATSLAISADGKYLATGTQTGVLCLRRRRDLALLQCTTAHGQRLSGLDFNAAGNSLASASWDGNVTLWRVPSLAVVARHKVAGSANDVAISASDGTIAIAVSGEPPVRTPELAAREKTAGVAHDPRAGVIVWNVSKQSSQRCKGHRAPVTSVAFSPNGTRLMSSSWDRSVRLWETNSCATVATVPGFGHLVRDVAIGAAGRRACVGAWSSDLASNSTLAFDLLYP